METSRPCKNCKKRTIIPDDVTGNLVCTSCGVVQDYDNFQAHIGGVTGAAGTYVRIGTVGSGGSHNYKETKIYEAQRLIEDITFKLGISKFHEVKLLVEKITDGEYGRGDWFPVFVGACAYVVMREDKKMLPINEVVDVIGCDVYELGRMISRVVDFEGVKLPELDIVNLFERAVRSCPNFVEVAEDVVKRILQQGVFLVQCLIKWFLTTGRRPMPVVAAVLVFAGELNQVPIGIEDVAKQLCVVVATCRRRYKELLETLVKVARALPWGKDVTVNNILKNAPFVIQYMEMKSMKKCDGMNKSIEGVDNDIQGLVDDCLDKEAVYGFDSYSVEECSSHYFEADRSSNLSIDYPDKFQISPECLALVYSSYLDDISSVKESIGIGDKRKRKRKRGLDLQACGDWWRGNSELSKKLLLKQIVEKDVGLDPAPPSFDKGCLNKVRRREKIKASKTRIQRIMRPANVESANSNDLCLTEHEKSQKGRKRRKLDTDWEDLVIETLLLHNVKEEEIENGHYNSLLALHVF